MNVISHHLCNDWLRMSERIIWDVELVSLAGGQVSSHIMVSLEDELIRLEG